MKQQIKRELKHREVYSECTFQPKINAISSQIAPSQTAAERSQNTEAIRKRELMR